ncbi:MAG: winged helix-turn-helix transcriptional regulator [Candidatus Micrarchaeota archaeon]|nr:winged helix-turn-helix transcriptional regulator [Candidatus Micrarchaeota archaeon]
MPLFEDIVHRALSSPVRRDILLSISEREKYLSEIAGEIGKKPQTIDFHISMLVEIGLVGSRWKGGKKYYFLIEKRIIDFLREGKPVPPGARPKPPHEIVQDMWEDMKRRFDLLEKRLDEIERKLG